jgi:hypothetical protein
MGALRNGRFRRWLASGLALTWLFTVLACTVDTDAIAAEQNSVSEIASPADHDGALHHHDGGSLDDPCCQTQASTIVSSNTVKLPHAVMLPVLMPVVLLLLLVAPLILPSAVATPDRDDTRRRPEFLVHSLQPQAPPR